MNISDKNNLNSKYDFKITFVFQSFKTMELTKKKDMSTLCAFSQII